METLNILFPNNFSANNFSIHLGSLQELIIAWYLQNEVFKNSIILFKIFRWHSSLRKSLPFSVSLSLDSSFFLINTQLFLMRLVGVTHHYSFGFILYSHIFVKYCQFRGILLSDSRLDIFIYLILD